MRSTGVSISDGRFGTNKDEAEKAVGRWDVDAVLREEKGRSSRGGGGQLAGHGLCMRQTVDGEGGSWLE